jgi:benzoate membrane transport protein
MAAGPTSTGSGTGFTADFNVAAFWAGITAFVWYSFGAIPIHIAVIAQLEVGAAQASSWIFVVWMSGAVASVILTLRYRQPIPITWTIPGLVYLGTLAGKYSFAEIVGANLMAGVLIVALGLLGIGGRIMIWLPLPIVMGMFGGSILGYLTRMVTATVQDFAVAGVTVAGFLIGRAVANPRLPPLGVAVVIGGIAVVIGGHTTPQPVDWSLPTLVVPEMLFTLPAFFAITLPMLVLAMGLGNVQGMGFLITQGYRVPVKLVTVVVGINSIVNAFLGGHPAIVARTGVAILASPDAGPMAGRYWANLIASVAIVSLAFAAAPMASLIGAVPPSYIFTLAGLAVLTAMQDALQTAFGEKLRFGSVVAFVVGQPRRSPSQASRRRRGRWLRVSWRR